METSVRHFTCVYSCATNCPPHCTLHTHSSTACSTTLCDDDLGHGVDPHSNVLAITCSSLCSNDRLQHHASPFLCMTQSENGTIRAHDEQARLSHTSPHSNNNIRATSLSVSKSTHPTLFVAAQQRRGGGTKKTDELLPVYNAASLNGGTKSALLSRDTQLGILSMFLLVFQGTALALTLRYSRAKAETPYLPSVAVIWTEALKLIICIAAQVAACATEAGSKGESLQNEMRRQYRDILHKSTPLLVPAALFVLQQVLVIVAASHLDAIMFQIFSQSFKIIPTAIFAVWLLGQHLSCMQWSSLPVLVVGVTLVTLNKSSDGGVDGGNWLLGMTASSFSGLSSAYAGVYFEKYVKGKHSASLWVRNLQLSLYGLPLSIAYALIKDQGAIVSRGMMQGFTWLTWAVVWCQVFGGLIVGMVVKYADNILKNFANAVSVILTVVLSIPLFGLIPSINFLLGVAVVLLSVFMYGNTFRVDTRTLERAASSSLQRHAALLRKLGLVDEQGGWTALGIASISISAVLTSAGFAWCALLFYKAHLSGK